MLRYSWIGGGEGKADASTYTLVPHAGGTRLTVEHTGFTGVGGFLLAKLVEPGWKKMLGTTFPAVLADLDEEGKVRPGSSLEPRF